MHGLFSRPFHLERVVLQNRDNFRVRMAWHDDDVRIGTTAERQACGRGTGAGGAREPYTPRKPQPSSANRPSPNEISLREKPTPGASPHHHTESERGSFAFQLQSCKCDAARPWTDGRVAFRFRRTTTDMPCLARTCEATTAFFFQGRRINPRDLSKAT